MWNYLIERDEPLNSCHKTTLQLTGTYTLLDDLNLVKDYNTWDSSIVSRIMSWSDGYKAKVEITMEVSLYLTH